MPIRILTARPHRLFAPMVEEIGTLHARGERIALLVPEQFTLEAERELMQRLHLEGMFTIDVYSPTRLYSHVLERAGRDEREPLNDAGRRMAVSHALERAQGKLSYYGAIAGRRGFVEKLSALMADLKRGGLAPEELSAYVNTLEQGVLRAKLTDIALLYAQYEAVLKDRFSDSEDQLVYVAGRLAQSGFLDGQHLYVYGFDTLPEQMMHLLCAAEPVLQSLTVALVMDDGADAELYKPVSQSVARFERMLAQRGIASERVRLAPAPLGHAPAIDHLDEALFSLGMKPFPTPQQSVFLTSGLSPFEEATLMTRQAMRLMKEGMPPERIAVLYPDQNGYAFAVSAALRDSGLPFYTDEKLAATEHGLSRYLLCALRAAADGFRDSDVLGMIKSGYAPLTFLEGCELENYAFTHGIRRKRWLSPFTKGAEAERMEALRVRLIEPVSRMRAALVAARDTTASMAAVFELLKEGNAYDKLLEEEDRLLASGFIARANQNSQVWQAILTLLDQLVRLADGARVPLKYVATRLECGLSALSLASLPPAGHMLHAGTLGHLMAEDVDAVFVLGLNDGVLGREADSLLAPEERDAAQTATGHFLGLTDEHVSLMARLDLKRAMTLPKKLLFLSGSKTALDGTALRPLSLLNTLQSRILPDLPRSPVPEDALPMSAAQATAELSVLLRAYRDGALPDGLGAHWQGVFAHLPQELKTSLARSLHAHGEAEPLAPQSARALYGDESLSVSRLEQFAQCPFSHFLNYGLRPHVLREWKVDPIETGTFYHDALHNFARIAKRGPQYPNVSDERAAQMADEAVAPLLQELLSGPMGDGRRSRARFAQACAALRRAAVTITRQLRAGEFQLYQTEAAFGYEGGLPPIVLGLSDGREVMLRGRIDRIDRYDTPDAVYLRVIDYKSSRQSLDAARTWWGLQLQLLLYLDVCTSAIPNGKPAGAFYFYVADPVVESDTDLKAVVEGKLRDVLQLRGITLADTEVFYAMETYDVGCVQPPIYLKSGDLRKNARALDLDGFTALIAHARDTAAQLASGLFRGVDSIQPTRDQSLTPCTYCDFSTICHFDPTAPDAPFRDLPDMDMDELREKL